MNGSVSRITGVILALCMLLGMLPLPTAAATEPAYYGRDALARMTNGKALVSAYDQLATGVAAMEDTISVSVPVDDVGTVFDAYFNDHGEAYYLSNGYSYRYNPDTMTTTAILLKYTETSPYQQQLFQNTLDDILLAAGVTDAMSDYDKAMALHDALIDHTEYNSTSTLPHSAYGAVVECVAVCDGYSKAYQCLLRKVGISSHLVTGYSVSPYTGESEGHAWNLVKLDGEYYYTDVTWDDQAGQRYYAYFNVTSAQITEDHWITEPAYGLPTCTATKANYFTHHPEAIITATPSVDTIVSLLGDDGFARVYVTGNDPDSLLDWYFDNAYEIAQKSGITGRYRYSGTWLGREYHLSMMGQPQSVATPKAVNGLVYTGSQQTGVPAGEGYTVTGNVAVRAGTYIATVRLNNGYVWSNGTTNDLRIEWSIAPKEITTEDLTIAAIPDQPYTGQAITPAVTVTCGQRTLRNGWDYTVTYTDNVQIGDTVTVTVTPLNTGNYRWSGSLSVSFKIAPIAGSISLKTASGQNRLVLTLPDTLDPDTHLVTTANSDGDVTLKYYTDADCTQGESLTPYTEPGVYWIKAYLAAGTHHTAAESDPVRYILVDPDDPNPPIEDPDYGKVDSDDVVAASDALLALQAATGKVVLTEDRTLNADVDAQVGVTANDALLILQFATKKITMFPCEK